MRVAPRRGNEPTAQGNALGMEAFKDIRPVRAKAFRCISMLLPLQGEKREDSFSPGRCPGLCAHCPFGALYR